MYYRLGTVALSEILQYQQSTKLLIRKLPFTSLISQIMIDLGFRDMKVQSATFLALQWAAEIYLACLFKDLISILFMPER